MIAGRPVSNQNTTTILTNKTKSVSCIIAYGRNKLWTMAIEAQVINSFHAHWI